MRYPLPINQLSWNLLPVEFNSIHENLPDTIRGVENVFYHTRLTYD